ncbi:class I SAM-dependent rRNA methyltransferase [Chloroflexi bacterium TSY]|nr:class I SAM-dependent rRNA methyltransferase [Chloroflexi bacterium TSY]
MSPTNLSPSAIILKPGRDKPVIQGHPWIFSGAIHTIPDQLEDGAIVPVLDSNNRWLAHGYLNRASQIQVRILNRDPNEKIDERFWYARLQQAIQARTMLAADEQTNVYRLVHAESDFIPGLTMDRYADYLVMQVGTLGIEKCKQQLTEQLLELTGAQGVIERSEDPLRHKEGLKASTGLLAGSAPPELLRVSEKGFQFYVDLQRGQKTGFYLDQRTNRARVAQYAEGRTVLNAFSYTSSFAVYAFSAGAQHVVNVDSSVAALELGEKNLALNELPTSERCEHIAGDIFEVLRDWRDFGSMPMDLIILDPPKFAQSKRQVARALRGYKDINLLAMQLLQPNGILATFSCSGLISAELFQKVIFGAAVDAGRSVQILEQLHQSSDHPISVTFPEGAYLKGLICRVL